MAKKIVIGNDHAALTMKNVILAYVKELGFDVINVGTDTPDRCDYPDYAYAACKKIIDKEADLGILICGTGVGMSIAANKVKGIRACACSESFSARMSREHNDANVICIGERVIGIETARDIVKTFLNSEFQNAHHTARVKKIMDIESGNYKA